MEIERFREYISRNSNALFGYLQDMIRINTENDGKSGSETALAEYIKDELDALGISSELYSPDDIDEVRSSAEYLPGRNLKERRNVTAHIPGNVGNRSLMLAAHLDTVPAGEASEWSMDPFSGTIKDGKIFGRGACDDKYALAAMLFLAKAFKELGIRLENELYLTGYVDEEFGGGNGALACCIKYVSDLYVNLDGHDFEIWNCACGGQRTVLTIGTDEPLDSCGKIIEGLWLCKREIDKFGERRRSELSGNVFFSGSDIPASALRYMSIGSGLNTSDKNVGIIDFAFYTDKTRIEICLETDELLKRISSSLDPLGLNVISLKPRSRFFTYGSIDSENENIRLLKEVSNGRAGTYPGSLSDLSLFLSAAPGRAFSFGGGRPFGVEGGAHQKDEFISCDTLIDFTKTVASFILEWDRRNQ